MGAVNINNTGSGASVALSSDGTSLLLNGTAIGGGSSTLTISNQTANYTVVSGDAGKIINCTANTFTVSLTAAATLGSGFNCVIWNTSTTSTDVITIDPNSAETIDGVATLVLRRGEGVQIVCNGTNWETGNKKTMRGYAENLTNTNARPTASGESAIAIGRSAVASGSGSLALGGTSSFTGISTASGTGSLAIGGATAGANYSTAIGVNGSANLGSVTATGAGSMALGGSYASGADSFAAAVASNSSSYGATGANGIALGYQTKATGAGSVAIGRQTTASSNYSFASGLLSTATSLYGVALGYESSTQTTSKLCYATGTPSSIAGECQISLSVFNRSSTDATAGVLTSTGGTGSTTNQLILPNNSAYAFTGTVVARQKAANGTASAAWKVEGLIRREANAGTTTLVASTVTAISNVPSWTLALSADTTNGGLAITATGAAATNIIWVATIQSSECIYA